MPPPQMYVRMPDLRELFQKRRRIDVLRRLYKAGRGDSGEVETRIDRE